MSTGMDVLALIWSGSPANGMVMPTFRVAFSASVKSLWKPTDDLQVPSAESQLLGNSKSCQIDKMNYHRYVDISKLEIKDYVKLF